MSVLSLTEDALRWLDTLRMHGRLRLKHVPAAVTCELVEARLARLTGGNLVITGAGMKGFPRARPPGPQSLVISALH